MVRATFIQPAVLSLTARSLAIVQIFGYQSNSQWCPAENVPCACPSSLSHARLGLVEDAGQSLACMLIVVMLRRRRSSFCRARFAGPACATISISAEPLGAACGRNAGPDYGRYASRFLQHSPARNRSDST